MWHDGLCDAHHRQSSSRFVQVLGRAPKTLGVPQKRGLEASLYLTRPRCFCEHWHVAINQTV
jgi:hypothetical protein